MPNKARLMYDLMMAGGDPAGMAADVYAARKGPNALLPARDFGDTGDVAKAALQAHRYVQWL